MEKPNAKVKIGKTIQYGAIAVEVREAEKKAELNGLKSPEGALFVVVALKLENKSAATAFIVPDEEIWLNCGIGDLLKPENYKFETALDAGKPSEGPVWFIAPVDAKKFSLLFGKRKMPKIPADFAL